MSNANTLTPAEEQAFRLSEAAIALDKAKAERGDTVQLVSALENNLEVWVAMKAVVVNDACLLPKAVKDNIARLAGFVADRTLQGVDVISENTIDSFININLQISEGLLEGAGK